MSLLYNPLAFGVLGNPNPIAPVPQLRVVGVLNKGQQNEAQIIFARFCEAARLSHNPSPNARGRLGDGSEYRIVTVGNSRIMTVWPQDQGGDMDDEDGDLYRCAPPSHYGYEPSPPSMPGKVGAGLFVSNTAEITNSGRSVQNSRGELIGDRHAHTTYWVSSDDTPYSSFSFSTQTSTRKVTVYAGGELYATFDQVVDVSMSPVSISYSYTAGVNTYSGSGTYPDVRTTYTNYVIWRSVPGPNGDPVVRPFVVNGSFVSSFYEPGHRVTPPEDSYVVRVHPTDNNGSIDHVGRLVTLSMSEAPGYSGAEAAADAMNAAAAAKYAREYAQYQVWLADYEERREIYFQLLDEYMTFPPNECSPSYIARRAAYERRLRSLLTP